MKTRTWRKIAIAVLIIAVICPGFRADACLNLDPINLTADGDCGSCAGGDCGSLTNSITVSYKVCITATSGRCGCANAASVVKKEYECAGGVDYNWVHIIACATTAVGAITSCATCVAEPNPASCALCIGGMVGTYECAAGGWCSFVDGCGKYQLKAQTWQVSKKLDPNSAACP